MQKHTHLTRSGERPPSPAETTSTDSEKTKKKKKKQTIHDADV